MTTRAITLALILTSISLALPAAAQQAQDGEAKIIPAHSERGGDRQRARGNGGQRGGMERMRAIFKNFDTNEDGSLTQAEIDAARAEQLSSFDADGSGGLTIEEYQSLWSSVMRERMVDQFQNHDDDGDGIVTAEEFGGRFANIVERMDRNGDGELNREDMQRRGTRGERGEGQAPAE